MPHIHLIFSLSLINLFLSSHFTELDALLFIIGSVIVDIDYLVYSNHRKAVTHKPIIYFILFIIFILLSSPLAVFFLAILIHLVTDIIDWEIELFYPFSTHKISMCNLDYNEFSNSGGLDFLKDYYSHKSIIISELMFFFLFIFSIFYNSN